MRKPTIEELERLLDGTDSPNIQIMPNGEVKFACENCLKLQERIKELEKALLTTQSSRPDKPRPIDKYHPTGQDRDGGSDQ